MSEDPTTPQESNSPEADAPQAQPEPTVEVKAEAVPEPAKAEPAAAKAAPTAKVPVSASAEPSQTQQATDKVLKQAQQFWEKAQPVLKEKSTQALLASNRFTNHFLDNIWPKLSQQAIAAIPASAKVKVEEQKVKVQPTLEKVQPVWEKAIVPFWKKAVVPTWMKGLGLLRQRLPENLARELTDRFMTIAILGLIVVVYWFFSSLGSGKPTVAKQPAMPRPTATPLSQRPMRPLNTQPSPQTAPVIKPTPKPSPVAIASPKPSPVAVASPKPSPVAVASPSPKFSPVAIASPKPSPAAAPVKPPTTIASKPAIPSLDLAAIQTQLSGAIAGLGDNLINSVQAQEATHKLSVALGESWTELNASDQTQVAQNLLEKAQQLKFNKLELRDNSGELVARSPLIGKEVIILKPSGNA
jgi:chemotaxis protein histidine kinase CheA